MQDWDTILRNRRNTGQFTGTTEPDQDAYFAFFAGRDTSMMARSFERAVQVDLLP